MPSRCITSHPIELDEDEAQTMDITGQDRYLPVLELEREKVLHLASLLGAHPTARRWRRKCPPDLGSYLASDLPLLPVAPWKAGENGYLGSLTSEETAKLATLRRTFPVSNYIHNDHDLLRFLRARQFSIPDTILMYQNCLDEYFSRLQISPSPMIRPVVCTVSGDEDGDPQGQVNTTAATATATATAAVAVAVAATAAARQKTRTGRHRPVLEVGRQIVEHSGITPRDEATTQRLQMIFREHIKAAVIGCCRAGRPVIWQKVKETLHGKYGTKIPLADRLALQSSSQEAVRLVCYRESVKRGYWIEDVILVLDMHGVNTMGMLKYLCAKSTKLETRIGLDYFPETLSKIFIINVPSTVGAMWNIINHLLPPRTREKIDLAGGAYREKLTALIEPKYIPVLYGGELEWQWDSMGQT